MAILTGTPVGTLTSQEEVYVEGAPYLYFQDYTAPPLYNPDGAGYYWGLSGTVAYPAYNVGCVQDVSLTEDVTMNDIRCDSIGVKGTIQKRNFVEFNLTILTLFPLTVLRHMLKLSAPTVATDVEKMGIGGINNNLFYMVYAPTVYDSDTGDLLIFHLHKAQFVDAFTIAMNYGEPWKVTGLKLRAYADETKPSAARFGTIIRQDPSAL
jgi:hypothetical protein